MLYLNAAAWTLMPWASRLPNSLLEITNRPNQLLGYCALSILSPLCLFSLHLYAKCESSGMSGRKMLFVIGKII